MNQFRLLRQSLCLLLLFLGLSNATALASTRVDIHSGPIVGSIDNGMRSFKGIPYATPPVGELRWHQPVDVAPWTSPKTTQTYASQCAQNKALGVFANEGGEEDCLYLNVFAPSKPATDQPLPVFVWFHGGSLLVGASQDYDPGKLVKQGNAVVVTVNYRLGIMGFFAPAALREHGLPTGNFGLMDQTFALQWVQKNIAKFGGDPDNVTIAGESSGGMSVYTHVLSPWSKGLFHHGIAQSGAALILKPPRFGAAVLLDDAENLSQAFAKAVSCPEVNLTCLRALPVETILQHQRPHAIVRPIVDGSYVPALPALLFKNGNVNKVTLLSGNTLDEARFFIALGETSGNPPMTTESYVDAMTGYFGAPLVDSVLSEYPLSDFNTPSEGWSAAVTDSFFACPAQMIHRWLDNTIPTYAYEFADRTAPSYLTATTYDLGASHTYELPYLFEGFHGGDDGVPVALNPLQEAFSDEMVKLWTQAHLASENHAQWPRFGKQETVLKLVLPTPVTTTDFGKTHHCDFWDQSGIY